VITLVCEERRHTDRCIRSVVERELSKRKKFGPVVLAICTIHADVLLEGSIHVFHLSVSLGMVAGHEVHGHVEKLAQCVEDGGNEFHASVGSEVGW
jgi:hypothetical protein